MRTTNDPQWAPIKLDRAMKIRFPLFVRHAARRLAEREGHGNLSLVIRSIVVRALRRK